VQRTEIEAIPDRSLRPLVMRLWDAKANTLRNRVVHKDAYRPTLEEAKQVHDEAREVLFGIAGQLKLGLDANWYTSKPGR
jgi:hypothetical protein